MTPKPLVRVTQIEAFRRYVEQSDHANFEITEQSVIDTVTQKFAGNEYTRIGTAFHSIVESGCPQCTSASQGVRRFLRYGKLAAEPVPEGRTFDVDGHPVTLDTAQCRLAIDYRREHPAAFHEVRLYADYGTAIVTGCADMVDALEIRDIKTKFSTPSDADYLNSCQWRFYLDMFGADTFHFDLFVFDGYNPAKHGHDVRGLPLVRQSPPITCYRYAGMGDDCRRLLRQFLEWAEARGLTQYLVKRKNL